MILPILAYLGGALTILSPCVLPVLPFVLARGKPPFARNGLPLLLGMAVSFAAVASLAAVAGGWAVRVNAAGRVGALVVLAGFGLALLLPALAERASRPFVALGDRLYWLADRRSRTGGSVGWSLLLGVATGLVWAPCAGPVLGLVLAGAAFGGASLATVLLLLAYAAGAATALGLALLAGGRALRWLPPRLGAWARRGAGAAVLAAVAAIGLGFDTGLITRASIASTAALERQLIGIPAAIGHGRQALAADLPVEGVLPSLAGAVGWLNSQPLTAEALRGKVVVVQFWTYSCINCLRSLPYVRAWADKYRRDGLVVIGVHSPEFAFEKDVGNVRAAAAELKLDYPIAIDSDFAIWRAFHNIAWPAFYFIDAQGRIRHRGFGEGGYAASEQVIRKLLAEAGRPVDVDADATVTIDAEGAEAPADWADIRSPEAYLGYEKAAGFSPPGGMVRDRTHVYASRPDLPLDRWALTGAWTIEPDRVVEATPGARITNRFHARDLHLVMGSDGDGPVRFRVLLDGRPPGPDHGADIDPAGNGVITGQRLYQLIRQTGPVEDRAFEIEFLDPGAEAFVLTFG